VAADYSLEAREAPARPTSRGSSAMKRLSQERIQQMLDIRALRRGSDGAEPSTPSEPVEPETLSLPTQQSRVHLPSWGRALVRTRYPYLTFPMCSAQ